jgi:hypothetical protein
MTTTTPRPLGCGYAELDMRPGRNRHSIAKAPAVGGSHSKMSSNWFEKATCAPAAICCDSPRWRCARLSADVQLVCERLAVAVASLISSQARLRVCS